MKLHDSEKNISSNKMPYYVERTHSYFDTEKQFCLRNSDRQKYFLVVDKMLLSFWTLLHDSIIHSTFEIRFSVLSMI